MKVSLTANERLALIAQPYLKAYQIRNLLGLPDSTVRKRLKDLKVTKYGGFGYLTDDVIEIFQLDGAIKRWKQERKVN